MEVEQAPFAPAIPRCYLATLSIEHDLSQKLGLEAIAIGVSSFTLFHNTHTRGHSYHLCHVNFFGTRVIYDWSNLTSDIVTNIVLNQL